MSKKKVLKYLIVLCGTALVCCSCYLYYNRFVKPAQSVETEKVTDSGTEEKKPGEPLGNDAALEEAKRFTTHASYSYQGLIDFLMERGFTEEEAKYGVDNCEADWTDQAYKQATTLLKSSPYSKKGLAKALEEKKFTSLEAEYGANAVETSWQVQAYKAAKAKIESTPMEAEELTDWLNEQGYEAEEVEFAVSNIFNGVQVNTNLGPAKGDDESEGSAADAPAEGSAETAENAVVE